MKPVIKGIFLSMLLGSISPLTFSGPADLDNDGVFNAYDPDIDGDGIPNIYEQYNPELKYRFAADGNADFDGDGWTNAEEYSHVTDLYDPNSNPDMLTGPELQKIFGFDAPANSEFGYSVDIEGDWAVIGAPWGYTTEDLQTGRRIEPIQTGAVYLYHMNQGEWEMVHKLLPYERETSENGENTTKPLPAGAHFGSSVSLTMASEGSYEFPVFIGVGADGIDKAFAFSPVAMEGPLLDAMLALGQPFYQNIFGGAENSFATSISIAPWKIMVGCPLCEYEFGRVDIYEYDIYHPGEALSTQTFTGCEYPYCHLGEKVILEGDTAVASAPALFPSNETVVVFTETDGVWSRDTELTSSLVENQDSFAANVTLSGDTILVSDYSSAELFGPVGNIYEFTRTDGVWSETGAIYAADFGGVALGNALDLSGDIAVTSDAEGNVIGLYRTGGTWVELARDAVAPADESIKEFLGVDADSGYTIIGAPEDFDGGENAGAAYFVDMTYIQ